MFQKVWCELLPWHLTSRKLLLPQGLLMECPGIGSDEFPIDPPPPMLLTFSMLFRDVVIDMVAQFVARYGEHFEESVKNDVSKHKRDICEKIGIEDGEFLLFWSCISCRMWKRCACAWASTSWMLANSPFSARISIATQPYKTTTNLKRQSQLR